MNELRVITRGKIRDNKLDQFRTLARACVDKVREKDKGLLQYDWFLNADYTEYVVFEQFVDSDAVLDHIANLGDLLGEFLNVVDQTSEIYGTPSEQLLKAVEDMDIRVYHCFQGL